MSHNAVRKDFQVTRKSSKLGQYFVLRCLPPQRVKSQVTMATEKKMGRYMGLEESMWSVLVSFFKADRRIVNTYDRHYCSACVHAALLMHDAQSLMVSRGSLNVICITINLK